jgi:PPOX class probable F420-dependent enzyme
VELSDALVEQALSTWPVARLAVLAAGSRPRVMPIVFARVSGELWSPVDGKPKAAREPARVRQVRLHPAVELLLDDYRDDWERLWWIRVEGLARVVQPRSPASDPEVAPVLRALERKYPQYRRTPVLRDPPTLLAIRPQRVRSWCAGAEAARGLGSGDSSSQ